MEYYLNGIKLEQGQPFKIGDLIYPWSYLEILSTSQLASMGITQNAPVTNFNTKYYWDVNDPKHLDDREELDVDGNPLYIKVWDATANNGKGDMVDSDKKMISFGLKTICTKEIKQITGSILAKTDWYLYRLAEREIEVPANVATHRAAIIAESDRLETAIAAVTDVEELITVMASQDWDDSLNPSV